MPSQHHCVSLCCMGGKTKQLLDWNNAEHLGTRYYEVFHVQDILWNTCIHVDTYGSSCEMALYAISRTFRHFTIYYTYCVYMYTVQKSIVFVSVIYQAENMTFL